MRTHHIPALDRHVSAIGFGCASLGSRISGEAGLKAVRAAMDLGVNWFDVAPPYGDGRAEHWLGQAVKGARQDMVICTKVGIRRPQISAVKRMVKPMARALIGAMPGLRGAVSRARSTGDRPLLAPSDIETSVLESLKQLGTDYIDVLALHEPPVSEVQRDDIYDAMHQLVAKGHVRSLSVAGDRAAVSAARQRSGFQFAQFPDSPFLGNAATLHRQTDGHQLTFVTHGVFGSGVLERMLALTPESLQRVNQIAEQYSCLDSNGELDWTRLLLCFALSNNSDGVVITSMFSESHAKQNCAIAGQGVEHGLAAALLDAIGDQK